mgnify:CR=1 FL=1
MVAAAERHPSFLSFHHFDAAPPTRHTAMAATVVNVKTRERLPLTALWQRGPVIIVAVRHFGCMFCVERLELVRSLLLRRVLRVPVVVLGCGTPEAGAALLAERRLTDVMDLVVDPTRIAYAELGFVMATEEHLTPPGGYGWRRACYGASLLCWSTLCCRVPGGSAGNIHQLGGVIAVPGGERTVEEARAAAAFTLVEQFPGFPELDVPSLMAASVALADGHTYAPPSVAGGAGGAGGGAGSGGARGSTGAAKA